MAGHNVLNFFGLISAKIHPFRDDFQHLIRAADAGHAGKDRVHEGRHRVFVGVAAGILDDNDFVIEIARRVDRGSNTDIIGAAGDNNGVDAT